MRKLNLIVLTAIAMAFVGAAIGGSAKVDYPSNYRSWQHVKSTIILPEHPLADPFGGIHHIYANSEAMNGLTSDQYEDGAVFVFDLLDYDDSNGLIVETDRKRIDVMQYDASLFAETGGWGYDTFVGDSATERLDQDVTVACYACHAGAKNSGYVFSQYRP